MTKWKTVCDSLPFGIFVVDGRGRITDLNHEGEILLSTSRSRALKSYLSRYFDNESCITEQLAYVRGSFRSVSVDEVLKLRSSQNLIPVEVSISLHDESPEHLIVAVRDISNRMVIERAKAISGDYENMDRILAEIAHEIKNPLSAILGAARLLQESEDDSVLPLADIVSEESLRLEAMLSNIQSFCRPPQVRATEINIHRLLKELVERQMPVLEEKQITITEYYDPSLPEIFADEEKIFRVILNILKNAVDACSIGGKITLHTGISMGDLLGKGFVTWLYLSIRDNGAGIPVDVREKIFTPFFTTKGHGNGLGLPISMKILRAHGGKIDVESTIGIGTNVTIYLPMKNRLARGSS